MKYKILVDNEDVTEYVPIPLSEQLTLDDSLDQGFLKLNYTNKSEAYRPFTEVEITIIDDNGNKRELDYFVASDSKSEIISMKKFNHELLLIEQSKWLERFLTGTKTVTNPLVHDYLATKQNVYYGHYSSNPNKEKLNLINYYVDTNGLESPEEIGFDLTVPSLLQWFNNNLSAINNLWTKLESGELTITNLMTNQEIFKTNDINENFNSKINNTMSFKITYYMYVSRSAGLQSSYFLDEFEYYVIQQPEPKPNKSITDAVNELLETIETLRESESPRFTFNSEQAEYYSHIDSPEFVSTGTLWEALSQIGSYVHSIPRLKGSEIYFDELGSNKLTDVDLSEYISHTEKFDIEQYASAIDSTVQNIINLDDEQQGSVIAPFSKGFKTPRTDTGTVQLTEENVFFQTKEPIGKIVDVEIGYINDETYVGSILPYVYEEAEYQGLSSYDDNYPYSKAFAIKYTIGQKNITELSFQLPNAISPAFSGYAIKNIIARKLNRDTTWLDNLFNTQNIMEIPYRITYIPYTNIRVRQKKQYKEDLEFDSSLAYNQSAQKVSSNAYGENMKGAIARLGNPEITKVYIFTDLSMIPKVGDLFDKDYYISVVKCEYYSDFVRCELGLSKNFNKLNEYVGIKNEVRFYEISEVQAYERYISYEDYCVIGNENEQVDNSLINANGIQRMANSFNTTSTKTKEPISLVVAKGYSDLMGELTEVSLAVTTMGMGNSIVFSFHYDDNYSAGEQVTKQSGSYLQYQTQYTDVYGEVDSLSLKFGNATTQVSDYESAVEQGKSLPLTSNLGELDILFDTGDDNIRIKKDNRETPIFVYQMHFVANNNNLVLGSALGRTSTFCSNITQEYKLYILPTRIPKFARLINLDNATYQSDLTTELTDYGFKLIAESPNALVSGKSWVICQGEELILGENIDIESGNIIELPTFTFTHHIGAITLIFDGNGGEWENGDGKRVVAQRYNTEYNFPVTPVKLGHTFNGWYIVNYSDNAEVDTANKVTSENVFTKEDNGKTIYANWRTNQYTITFNKGSAYRTSSNVVGTGALSSGDTIYYGDKINISGSAVRSVRITMNGVELDNKSDTFISNYQYSLVVNGDITIEMETAEWQTVGTNITKNISFGGVGEVVENDISIPEIKSNTTGYIQFYGTVSFYTPESQFITSNFDLYAEIYEGNAEVGRRIILNENNIVEVVANETGREKATIQFEIPEDGVLRVNNTMNVENNYFYEIYFEEILQLK